MTNSATRVKIDLVHQLFDGLLAIPNNVPGYAFCNRYQLAVYHQHSVVETLDVALHQHTTPTSVFQRFIKRRLHLLIIVEIDGHPASMVGIQRF